MTPRTSTPPPRLSPVRRFGPLAAVLVALGLVAALASTGRDEVVRATSTSAAAGNPGNPNLPIQWNDAKKAGTTSQYDWGPTCDKTTGRVKVPTVYAPPCLYAPPKLKGGATYQGVTATSIKVVLYQAADDDLAASLNAQLDSAADTRATQEALIHVLESTFQTWGRKIDIVNFKGTGSDETSSRADAIKVAKEIKAFASIGGPGQESAYAEELAANKVLCIGCGLALPDSALQDNAPYLWGNLQTPEQYLVNLGDFIIGRLVGKPPAFAGSEDIRKRKERVFGVVHFEQDPPVYGDVEKMVAKEGGDRGYKAARNLTYQLVISELPTKARDLVADLKEHKVTTVIFLGDPVMPVYLTKAATAQGYFPEWIITGTVLTDTTVFGRLYDQRQWAHAFGVSSLPARVPQKLGEAWQLHQWFYGKPPAAEKTAAVIYEPIRIFMLGVHMAGPNLTPETFRDGLFAYPPTGGTPLHPQLSFGDHGYFGRPDYNAVDDMQIIWWDAEAEGPDEQGKEGKGMMRYTEGGRRYLPGTLSPGDPGVFDRAGSVTVYDKVPPGDEAPSYPSPGPGG
jgi:hypothetical protein